MDTFLGNAPISPSPAVNAAPPAAALPVTSTVIPTKPDSSTSDRWSHKEIDFHWLELFNAVYHLKIGRFKDGLVQAGNVDLQGTIQDRNLNIDAVTAFIFGAEVAGKATITGGKIPGVNMAANIVSLDIEQIVPFIPVLRGIVGKYNLSIRLDTSGINMASWVTNLEGTLGVGGRDVVVNGFNLPGVIRVVTYVRTVADILNVIKRAWPGGDTAFSSLEGQWNISAGVMKTANARLRNDQADVTLAGEVDLVNWKTQDQMVFSLKALDFAHPPTMTLEFIGDLDKPEMSLDTRSLEEYITNKTSEKMLEQYGTH
jgi:AsmA protein